MASKRNLLARRERKLQALGQQVDIDSGAERLHNPRDARARATRAPDRFQGGNTHAAIILHWNADRLWTVVVDDIGLGTGSGT